MRRFKTIFSALLLITESLAIGQVEDYRYKRDLEGVKEQWHKIELPDDLFGKLNESLTDLRIFGFNQAGDTVEAPYLWSISNGKTQLKSLDFTLINKSNNSDGTFFTFNLPVREPVNQIELEFVQTNFDWLIKLEGSQNMKEWFTVLDNYRILSIHNEMTTYQFTKLALPDSRYSYYRLCIKNQTEPSLIRAKINHYQVEGAQYRQYAIATMATRENKETRQTLIDVELNKALPVAMVILYPQNGIDFFRPLSIRTLTDSVKTEQGWIHNYTTLASGTLSSIEHQYFTLPNTVLKNLRIVIDNSSNQPLVFDSVVVKGFHHSLLARFNPDTRYHLYYGAVNAMRPIYDIEQFESKIPVEMTSLKPGVETILMEDQPEPQPWFVHEAWLWLVMALVILTLGWFTLGMMKKSASQN